MGLFPKTTITTACTPHSSLSKTPCELRVIQFLAAPEKQSYKKQEWGLRGRSWSFHHLHYSSAKGVQDLETSGASELLKIIFCALWSIIYWEGWTANVNILQTSQAVKYIHQLLDYCFWVWCMQSPVIWKYSNLLELYSEFYSVDKGRGIWAKGSERIFYWKQYSRCIQNSHLGDIQNHDIRNSFCVLPKESKNTI